MRDGVGREFARFGDSTDHGGTIIEAAAELAHLVDRRVRFA